MEQSEQLIWRSLLFVPAHQQRFIHKAVEIGVDACILDLEDGIGSAAKAEARDALVAGCAVLRKAGVDAFVRVDTASGGAGYDSDDIGAAVAAGVTGLVLPKVDTANAVVTVAEQLDSIPAGDMIVLIAQIEDVAALPNLDSIAQSSTRLVGLALGTEDFSASAGMVPSKELLFGPCQSIVFACRRAGIQPYGFPSSIAEFGDVENLRASFSLARDMGFVGAMCIHPRQALLLNEIMAPTDAELREAEALLAAWERGAAQGEAVISHAGRMVDKPVVLRAENLIARARRWRG